MMKMVKGWRKGESEEGPWRKLSGATVQNENQDDIDTHSPPHAHHISNTASLVSNSTMLCFRWNMTLLFRNRSSVVLWILLDLLCSLLPS